MTELEQHRRLLHEGERFFRQQAERLSADVFPLESGLPGWTRAQVVAHVIRNAGGIGNLIEWAATGIERPMYDEGEDRDEAIRVLADRPAPALLAHLSVSSEKLLQLVESVPPRSWSRLVRMSRGRVVRAARLPWLRAREVWLHGVDLQAGASFGEFPPALLSGLFHDAMDALAGREDCPAIVVKRLGSNDQDQIGGEGPTTVVEGDLASLVGWLSGRTHGATLQWDEDAAPLPVIPPWP